MRLPLLLISSYALWAHDLYLIPQKFHAAAGDSILLSVHTGDSFPQSEQPVDPARLTNASTSAETTWRILGKATHATVKLERAGGHYFAAWTKPRMLTMEAAKFEAYLKEEGLRGPLELRSKLGEASKPGREMYSKFAKTYVVADAAPGEAGKALGLKIEFVPQVDPASVQPGEDLPLVVLYNGSPLANAQVELAFAESPIAKGKHSILGRTDAKGKITARIPAAGRIRLHCVQMERVQSETHDWESYWASFTFEVKGASAEASGLSARR